MVNIMLTGATGFLGGALQKRLQYASDVRLTVAARYLPGTDISNVHLVSDLSCTTNWSHAVAGQQVVIHAAARAHVMKDKASDPLAEYRRVNVEGTLNLARQAAEAGVKRFVFISSIKVNGESTREGSPFRADDPPNPQDAYGQSKYEAEVGLLKMSNTTDMKVVIIRPPLIYGAGVKGNFARIIELVRHGIPLPLGAIHNHRSFVGIDNLVDLIVHSVEHPAAANRVLLAGDGEDLSTTELLQALSRAIGQQPRLIPVPAVLLQCGANLLGKGAMAQRLLGSLQVDISQTCELLAWRPPYSVDEGLKRCFNPENEKT